MAESVRQDRVPEGALSNHRFYVDLINDSALDSLITLLLDMQPGEQLPSERELTQSLKLSRNTLRDRIGRLESMGVLERKERLGTYYTGVQPEHTGDVLLLSLMFQQMTVESLVSVRHALERQAAIEACQNASEENLGALEASVEAMRHTEDGRELLEADGAFHRALFAASGSPALIFFSQMLHAVLQGTLRHLTLAQDFHTMREVHEAVLLAVQERDVASASEAIDGHFRWLHVLRGREQSEAQRLQDLQGAGADVAGADVAGADVADANVAEAPVREPQRSP